MEFRHDCKQGLTQVAAWYPDCLSNGTGDSDEDQNRNPSRACLPAWSLLVNRKLAGWIRR